MKLIELDPRWAVGAPGEKFLTFDCPGHLDHRLAVMVGPEAKWFVDGKTMRYIWKMDGDNFDNLSLTPSIQESMPIAPGKFDAPIYAMACGWHGFIKNGDVIQ